MTMSGDVPNLPTPLPPAPRSVTGGGGCLRAIGQMMSVLVMMGGLVALMYFILCVVWVFHATETTGNVTGTRISKGSKSTSYYVTFTYPSPKGVLDGEESVTSSVLRSVEGHNGMPVKVRYLHVWPFELAGLPELESVWWTPAKGLLILGLVGGFGWMFFWGMWIAPAIERALVRDGIARLGAVTDKKATKGKSTTYSLQYAYDTTTGQRLVKWVVLKEALWSKTQIGDIVTVLVNPRNEKKSLVYEFSNMKVRA